MVIFHSYVSLPVGRASQASHRGMGCFMDDMTLALLRSPWAMESKAQNDYQSFAPMESQYQAAGCGSFMGQKMLVNISWDGHTTCKHKIS